MSMRFHSDEQEEIRYIPDLMLAGLEKELEEWSQPFSVVEKTLLNKKNTSLLKKLGQ